MNWKRLIFIIGASAMGFGVMAAYWYMEIKPSAGPETKETKTALVPMNAPFVTIVDPSKGSKDAVVTIVEFGDHSCPFCQSAQETIDRLMTERPGQVRFVWKSAPSPLHPGASEAAAAALCAERQGKFWEYHAKLFENSNLFDQTSLAILANEIDLDSTLFNQCVTQDLTLPLVERTVTEAQALGLTSIPTIFINDARYEGALSYEQLLEATGL